MGQASPEIPTTKLRVTRRVLLGPVLTLSVLTALELMAVAGYEIPNPTAVYYIPLVWATLSGGLYSGLLSAVITIIYALFFFSQPGDLFSYNSTDMRRVLVVMAATPALVVVVWFWRRRSKERAADQIVELQGALAAHREAEALLGHLASVIESAEDAIYTKDLAGRVMTWNPAAERLYGYSKAEILGKPATLLMPPEKQGDMRRILQTIMAGGKVRNEIAVRRRKDGRVLKVSLSVSALKNPEGNIVGASAIARETH